MRLQQEAVRDTPDGWISSPPRWHAIAREQIPAVQRMRIIAAIATLASERDAATITIREIVAVAGVSTKTFYEIFEDRSDSVLAAIDHAWSMAAERAQPAYETPNRWVDRMRSGLAALLAFCDEEPEMAHLCMVTSAAAGPTALGRRRDVVNQLARLVDEGRILTRRQPPPFTAEGVIGAVSGVIHARLLTPGHDALIDLLNPLVSMIVLPYRGEAAARKQLDMRRPRLTAPAVTSGPPAGSPVPVRLTHRTLAVLTAISQEPGLNNIEIAKRAGIRDEGQISKLLARLAHCGLMVNRRDRTTGTANEWHLTHHGEAAQARIARALRS